MGWAGARGARGARSKLQHALEYTRLYVFTWYSAAIAAIDCIIIVDCKLGTLSTQSMKLRPKEFGSSRCRNATPQRKKDK
jgi:hypothetical protein